MAYTTIDKPDDYFNTLLWTGNGASPRALSGLGFNPDWIWAKVRNSGSVDHAVWDSVRGGNNVLTPNQNYSENNGSAVSAHGVINSFTSPANDGFTVADGSNATYPRLYVNDSSIFGGAAGTYVGWCWKAGGTASSNTNGSITSSVSANTTAGFSIVSYSGNSTGGATIGHGLGTTPAMFIIKNRTTAGEHWAVYHQSISPSNMLYLNLTNAQDPANQFNSTAPTSNVFSVSSNIMVNASSNNYIAYCFAEKKGFSKFGKYIGNGSTDGTFVYTGFKPAFVITKRTDSAENWDMLDNKRNTYNVSDKLLKPNLINAEATFSTFDMLSNGFKMRNSDAEFNASGGTYIYMAFAENPFVTSTGIPTPAR